MSILEFTMNNDLTINAAIREEGESYLNNTKTDNGRDVWAKLGLI